jgi:hypothetical protein
MTAEHTPTPYIVHENEKQEFDIQNSGCVVAEIEHTGEQGRIDAEFIVRACNSHKALVEACRTVLSEIAMNVPRDILPPNTPGIRKAQAALALTKGENHES